DGVRRRGLGVGLAEASVWRHPFPGPGWAVRCLGPVTAGRLEVLRQADTILLDELKQSGWYRQTAQAFVVLLPVQSVGVMGDGRTYENVIAVRAVQTEDYMTADWAHLPYELLAKISTRIINEVKGVNRVVYDISSKPPATIEWERKHASPPAVLPRVPGAGGACPRGRPARHRPHHQEGAALRRHPVVLPAGLRPPGEGARLAGPGWRRSVRRPQRQRRPD